MQSLSIGNIFLAILVLGLNSGIFLSEACFWIKHHSPKELSCDKFLQDKKKSSHIRLLNCEFDWDQTIQISPKGKQTKEKGYYCIPVYPKGKKTFKISLLLVVEKINLNSSSSHTSLQGMVISPSKTKTRGLHSSLQKTFSDHLASNFILIKEGQQPSLKKALSSALFSFLTILYLISPRLLRKQSFPSQKGRLSRERQKRRAMKNAPNLSNTSSEETDQHPSKESISSVRNNPNIEKVPFFLPETDDEVEDELNPEDFDILAQSGVRTPDNTDQMLDFSCPRCKRKTSLKKEFKPFGKKKRCKGCGGIYNLSKKTLVT